MIKPDLRKLQLMKIERLEIFTAGIEKQKRFYKEVLGLDLRKEQSDSFEVQFGYSTLRFAQKEEAKPYHIAIHIPDKQEREALDWLKKRVEILKAGDDEIVDFSNWNARSGYFYDEDLNIMELISRRNFFKTEPTAFSSKSFLGIAEIGLATNDISEKFRFLKNHCSLEVFDGNFEKFCAIGDDEGLLITINKNLKDWFPTDDKAFPSEFSISLRKEEKIHHLVFEKDQLLLK